MTRCSDCGEELIRIPKSPPRPERCNYCEIDYLRADRDRLLALISRPYIGAWADEVLVEAAHQVERWGVEHDTGKTAADWFWLIGYLAGKALHAALGGEISKAHHHTVSTAAALANWAAQISGRENVMRPGLGPEKLLGIKS